MAQEKASFGPNAGLYCYTVYSAEGYAVRIVYAASIKDARKGLAKGEYCRVASKNGDDC